MKMGILPFDRIFDVLSDDVSYDVIWRNMEKTFFLDFLRVYISEVNESGIIRIVSEWPFQWCLKQFNRMSWNGENQQKLEKYGFLQLSHDIFLLGHGIFLTGQHWFLIRVLRRITRQKEFSLGEKNITK